MGKNKSKDLARRSGGSQGRGPHQDQQQPRLSQPVIHQQITAQIESTLHQGPLPTPQLLAGYGQINPTYPDRIFQMAEREQAHRHEQDRIGGKWLLRSQIFGVTLGLCGIGTAVLALCLDHAVAASTIIGTVAGIVGAFLWHDTAERRANAKSAEGNADDD